MAFSMTCSLILEKNSVTASMKVLNDIINATDSKEYCAAQFLDLSKTFNTVDIFVLLMRLANIGLSSKTIKWFENYLSGRM